MRIIEIAPAEQRQVSVAIAVGQTRQGPAALEYREVPERYAPEPRCRDAAACDERVAALALATMAASPPTPDPAADVDATEPSDEDPLAWL